MHGNGCLFRAMMCECAALARSRAASRCVAWARMCARSMSAALGLEALAHACNGTRLCVVVRKRRRNAIVRDRNSRGLRCCCVRHSSAKLAGNVLIKLRRVVAKRVHQLAIDVLGELFHTALVHLVHPAPAKVLPKVRECARARVAPGTKGGGGEGPMDLR